VSVRYVKAFNADLGELSLNLESGDLWKRFTANRVTKVQVGTTTKKFLFRTKQVERLEIYAEGETEPYVIEQGRFKDDYAWAKEVLQKFCEKNKIKYAS